MRSTRMLLVLLVLGIGPAPLFGADKVQLNQATQEQLLAVGFTQSQAVQIINYRKSNGDFLQVEELLAVPQVSRATLDKLHDKLTVDE